MSNNLKQSSSQDSLKSNFFYDFLYADTKRILSFLSNLNGFGAIQEIIKKEGTLNTSIESLSDDCSFGIPHVVSGGRKETNSVSNAKSQNLEEKYDASVLNNLLFVQQVTSLDIKTNIKEAKVNELISLSGNLELIDLSILKNTLNSDEVFKMCTKGKVIDEKDKTILKTLLSSASYSYQGYLTNKDEQENWFVLSRNYLLQDPNDIVVKYNGSLPGQWFIIGILESQREESKCEQSKDKKNRPFLWQMAMMHIDQSEELYSRPKNTPCIMPLLIYREVNY